MASSVTFNKREPVDFAIIGSGSAGGIIAKELATAGFNVVVFEQGPYRKAQDFTHDEYSVLCADELLGGGPRISGQTFRSDASETAESPVEQPIRYAQTVGGSSVHFTANFWRLRPVDFNERSLLGSISGTNFADWPISYEELEPYYTKVDWEIGVSGAPGPYDAPRSKPFPMPPLPIKSSGVLLEKAAAEASGHCEIRADSAVFRIETDEKGRASEVLYYDVDGNEQAQKVKAVIVSANGAETSRLMLMSASEQHPDGLANSSGFVGRNLMFNAHSAGDGVFEQPLNDYKGAQVSRIIHEFYESDEKRGFYGGGGIDSRPLWSATPIFHALEGMPPDVPSWSKAFKDEIAHNFTRQMSIVGSTTSLALDRNNITLDPANTDQWGRPAIRLTYRDHDDDLAMAGFLQDRAMELFDAAGTTKAWRHPIHPTNGGEHLLGTCRMGDDPSTSVVDRYHRSHDVPNLFICDGSSFVTSGRGQPTMTIMALAFRAAHHIKIAASAGEI